MSLVSAVPDKNQGTDVVLLAGLVLSSVLGLVLFGYGLYSFTLDVPLPYSTALVLAGFLAPLLSWYSSQRSRVAWSFLLSLDGTAALVFLFGASRIRDAFDVHLSVGLVPAVLFGIAAALVATTDAFRS